MRAMLLAAGLGTRLRPLTDLLPKPAVPVCNTPLVATHLDRLAAAGVDRLVINLHHLPEKIEGIVGDGSRWGVQVNYSRESGELLGTGGGLAMVQGHFADQPEFILCNADVVHDIDLDAVVRHHRQVGGAVTMVLIPHPGSADSVVLTDPASGEVLDIAGLLGRERPDGLRGLFTGVQVLSPPVLSHLPPAGTSGCIVRTAYRSLLATGHRINAWYHQGHWADLGTPAAYLQANLRQLDAGGGCDGTLLGAHFPGRRFQQPVEIGREVEIHREASIGPQCVLGDGCRIEADTRLERTLVWPGVTVKAKETLIDTIAFPGGRLRVAGQ